MYNHMKNAKVKLLFFCAILSLSTLPAHH